MASTPLDWLRQRQLTPLTLVAGPGADAVHRTGLTVPLGGGEYLARDVPWGPADRAAHVAHLVPRAGVLARRAAAWVHTGGPCPEQLDVVLPTPRRHRPGRVRTRIGSLRAGDVVVLGCLRVTSVDATLVDVLRWEPADDAVRLARALLGAGASAERAVERCEAMYRYAGTARALEVLRLATAPSG